MKVEKTKKMSGKHTWFKNKPKTSAAATIGGKQCITSKMQTSKKKMQGGQLDNRQPSSVLFMIWLRYSKDKEAKIN